MEKSPLSKSGLCVSSSGSDCILQLFEMNGEGKKVIMLRSELAVNWFEPGSISLPAFRRHSTTLFNTQVGW